jgi:hypothetical protein
MQNDGARFRNTFKAEEERDFCILICNFVFLSLLFDISPGSSHCLEGCAE